jgi:hypothetical protein
LSAGVALAAAPEDDLAAEAGADGDIDADLKQQQALFFLPSCKILF